MTKDEATMLHYELEGVAIDGKERGFDDVCLETIRRVQSKIAALSEQASKPVAVLISECSGSSPRHDLADLPEVLAHKPQGNCEVSFQQYKGSNVCQWHFRTKVFWKEIGPLFALSDASPAASQWCACDPDKCNGEGIYRCRWKNGKVAELRNALPAAAPVVSDAMREEILRIARMAESLKRDCGMDPECPQAVRNGEYMNISYALRAILSGEKA